MQDSNIFRPKIKIGQKLAVKKLLSRSKSWKTYLKKLTELLKRMWMKMGLSMMIATMSEKAFVLSWREGLLARLSSSNLSETLMAIHINGLCRRAHCHFQVRAIQHTLKPISSWKKCVLQKKRQKVKKDSKMNKNKVLKVFPCSMIQGEGGCIEEKDIKSECMFYVVERMFIFIVRSI